MLSAENNTILLSNGHSIAMISTEEILLYNGQNVAMLSTEDTGGSKGAECPLDSEKCAKNQEKVGENHKKEGKHWEKEEKSGRFFHFAPPAR